MLSALMRKRKTTKILIAPTNRRLRGVRMQKKNLIRGAISVRLLHQRRQRTSNNYHPAAASRRPGQSASPSPPRHLSGVAVGRISAKIAGGPYHGPMNGRGAPDRGDELCGAASVASASAVFVPLILSLTHLSTSLARFSSGRPLALGSISIQQSSEARCCMRGCGAASVAGASVGYPIRISLTVGLAARICGFEEA